MEAGEQPHRVVGGYRLLRPIAGEARGDIYLAEPTDGGELLTLQIFDRSVSPEGEFPARVRHAMQTASRLNHESIARISDVGLTEQDRVFVAMPFEAATSLRAYIDGQDEPPPATQALRLVTALAEGLKVVLRAGLVHEDLHPGNILLRKDGRPVLLGLDMPPPIDVPRSWLAYRSPEQRAGKVLDARSNIYSLGAILYELLAGSPPQFDARGDPQPLETLRPGLSNRTHNIVRKSLRPQSWARFQTMQEMVSSLKEASVLELPREELAGADTIAAVRRRPAPASRPSRRRTCAGLLLIPLLLLTCGLLAAVLLPGSEWAQALIPGEPTASRQVVLPTEPLPAPEVEAVTPQTIVATEAPMETNPTVQPTPTLLSTPSPMPSPTLAVTPTAQPAGPPTAQPTMPPEPPTPAVTDEVVAPRWDNTPPAIDGNLAEWTQVGPVVSAHRVYADSEWDGSDDLRVLWRLAWDDEYLYVAVAAEDDVHVQTRTEGTVYMGDSLEMQFDTARGEQPDTLLAPDDFQIMLSPGNFDTLPPEFFRYRATEGGDLEPLPGAQILVAAQPAEQGYFLEAAIPWAALNVTPAQGLVLGLALNANDNDLPDSAWQAVMMSNAPARTLRDPSTWGTLRLE